MNSELQAQAKSALEISIAIGEAIRDVGEVPSGELYARLMSRLTYEAYAGIIDLLVKAKMIEVKGHLIRWIGPAKPTTADDYADLGPDFPAVRVGSVKTESNPEGCCDNPLQGTHDHKEAK